MPDDMGRYEDEVLRAIMAKRERQPARSQAAWAAPIEPSNVLDESTRARVAIVVMFLAVVIGTAIGLWS